MTIRRGGDWGTPGVPPGDLPWFDDDRGASDAVARGTARLGLRGGDLARTLGVGGAASSVEFAIDVLRLESPSRTPDVAIAHVVVRRRVLGWWRGPVSAAMNAQYRGEWDVAPRGHPNDGRVEVLEVDERMSLRQRWAARRRLPTGAHLPHPMISASSRSQVVLAVPPRSRVEVDGRCWFTTGGGQSTEVRIDVHPDAITVWTADVDGEVPLSP